MPVFQTAVRNAVAATLEDGRHADVDPLVLTLYTNSVLFGAAILFEHQFFSTELLERDVGELVAQIIELVVPIAGRTTS